MLVFIILRTRAVLSNFNLKVKAGTTVAVGEAGSGKSTIVNLLYRFMNRLVRF